MGATAGLILGGLLGSLFAPRPAPARPLRWVALAVIVAAPFLGAALTLLLQRACPLYTYGPASRVLRLWRAPISWVDGSCGVVAVFILDVVIVAGFLLMSAIEVEHGRPDAHSAL